MAKFQVKTSSGVTLGAEEEDEKKSKAKFQVKTSKGKPVQKTETAAERLLADRQKRNTPAPVDPNRHMVSTTPDRDATLGEETAYVAGGIGQAAMDAADFPTTIARGGRWVAKQLRKATTGVLGDTVGNAVIDYNPGIQAISAIAGAKSASETGIGKAIKEVIAPEFEGTKKSATAEAMRTFLEWTAGGGPSAVKKGAQKGFMAAVKDFAPEVVVGSSAAGGEAVGGEKGEMIAGLLSLPAAVITGRLVRPKQTSEKGVQRVLEMVDDNISGPNGKAATEADKIAVRKKIADSLADPKERGTLAQRGENQGLYDIEKSILEADPKGVGRAIAAETIARDDNIAADVAAAFGDDVADAADVAGTAAGNRAEQAFELRQLRAERRLTDAEEAIIKRDEKSMANQERAAEAAKKAEADLIPAKDKVATDVYPAQASADLDASYDYVESTLRNENVNPAFEEFLQGPDLTTEPMMDAIDRMLAKGNKVRKVDGGATGIDPVTDFRMQAVKAENPRVFAELDNWRNLDGEGKAIVSPLEIQDILSDLKAINRNASNAGNYGPNNKVISEIIEVFDQSLRKTNPAYRKAMEAAKDLAAKTKDGRILTARIKNEPETFAQRLNFKGDAGAATARFIKRTDDAGVNAAVQQRLKSEAAFAEKPITQKWINDRRDVLDLYPGLRDDFQTLVNKREAAILAGEFSKDVVKAETAFRAGMRVDMDNQIKAAATRLAKSEKGDIQKLLRAYSDNPKGVLPTLFTQMNVGKLTQLYKSVAKAGGGPALKAQMRAQLMAKVMHKNPDGTISGIAAKAMNDFMATSDILKQAGVLSADEVVEMTVQMAKSTGDKAMRAKAISSVWTTRGGKWDALTSSAAAAGIMDFLGIKQSLILAGAVRRTIKEMMAKQDVTPEMLDLMEDFTMNPEKYLQAVKDSKSVKEAMNRIFSPLSATVIAGQVTAGETP